MYEILFLDKKEMLKELPVMFNVEAEYHLD